MASGRRVAMTSHGHRLIIVGFLPRNVKTKAVAVESQRAAKQCRERAGHRNSRNARSQASRRSGEPVRVLQQRRPELGLSVTAEP